MPLLQIRAFVTGFASVPKLNTPTDFYRPFDLGRGKLYLLSLRMIPFQRSTPNKLVNVRFILAIFGTSSLILSP